jgi:hypothetical protein
VTVRNTNGWEAAPSHTFGRKLAYALRNAKGEYMGMLASEDVAETVSLALQLLTNWQAGLCPVHGNSECEHSFAPPAFEVLR